MRCIIVDDEPLAREGMELNVGDVPFLELVGQFGNALSAFDFMQTNPVDLVFLDIQMPGLTGLEFLRSLKDAPLVILTTAYPQFALEAFELNVVDYLVKPVRLNRFVKAVGRAKEIFDLYQSTPKESEMQVEEDYFYIRADRKLVRLFFEDILYIKGMKDYVLLHTKSKRHMTAMNIKTIFNQLPVQVFARVSKSFIINVNYIDSIEQDMIQLAGEEIPLGRTYRENFVSKYVSGKLIDRK